MQSYFVRCRKSSGSTPNDALNSWTSETEPRAIHKHLAQTLVPWSAAPSAALISRPGRAGAPTVATAQHENEAARSAFPKFEFSIMRPCRACRSMCERPDRR